MPERSTQVKFRVTPEFKAEIDQYVEESPDADSIAVLCRTCLRHKIHGDNDSGVEAAEEVRREVEDALDPVTEELERLRTRLADVEQAVGPADPTVRELADELYHNLPLYQEWKPIPELEGLEDAIYAPDTVGEAQQPSTAKAWANFFDVDEQQVRHAAAEMLKSYPDATYWDDDGVRRFFRREE